MANVAQTNNVAVGGFNPLRVIDTFFSNLSASYSKSRQFRATYNELSALSARELADLGISRSDIARIAYEAAYENEVSEFKR